MKASEPPRVALALLRRFVPDNEPLAGDLVEGFAAGRSRLWFWREVLVAVAIRSVQPGDDARPLGLAERSAFMAGEPARDAAPVRRINLTASPLPGVGGLGLVALGVLVALVRPDAWWIFLPAVLGGVLLGVAMVILRWNRPLHEPNASWRRTSH